MVEAYWYIRGYAEKNGGKTPTRRQVSEHLGCSYQIAVRLIEDMSSYGIIRFVGKNIRLIGERYDGGPIPSQIYDFEKMNKSMDQRRIVIPVYGDDKQTLKSKRYSSVRSS